MPIPWSKLPQTVTRQRAVEVETPLGEMLQDWTIDQQVIVCNLQKGWGREKYETEGMAPDCMFTLFCNLVTDSTYSVMTDVEEGDGDRIIDSQYQYRVVANRDAAGIADHYEIRLYRILPKGDG